MISSSKLHTAVHDLQNSIAMHVLTLVLHVDDVILEIRAPSMPTILLTVLQLRKCAWIPFFLSSTSLIIPSGLALDSFLCLFDLFNHSQRACTGFLSLSL